MKCKRSRERRRKRKHRDRRAKKAYYKTMVEAAWRLTGDYYTNYSITPLRWRGAVFTHIRLLAEQARGRS